MRTSWRIGTLLGIEIRIDYSWLIIFGLVSWILAGSYFPQRYPDWPRSIHWIVGLATSILFFLSVLGHELTHSLVARAQGETVRSITLFLFGGVAQINQEPDRPSKEFLMAFAGPLSSLAIAGIFAVVWWATRQISQPVAASARYLSIFNIVVGAFNLLPGFPLDGGRVLRAVIWKITGDLKKATRVASRMGEGVAFILIIWGIVQIFGGMLLNGLWFIFIGWFLHTAASSGYHQVVMREMLHGVRAEDLMTRDFETVPGALTVRELVDNYILRKREHAFLVTDNGSPQGIICTDNIESVPREKWESTRVEEIMTPREQMETVVPEEDGNKVLSQLAASDLHQLPVMVGGRIVGILCHSDIIRFLHLRAELGI